MPVAYSDIVGDATPFARKRDPRIAHLRPMFSSAGACSWRIIVISFRTLSFPGREPPQFT